MAKLTSKEEEYLRIFKHLYEDGFINRKERKALDQKRDDLEIEKERALKLEEREVFKWNIPYVFAVLVLLLGVVLLIVVAVLLKKPFWLLGYVILIPVVAIAKYLFGKQMAWGFVFVAKRFRFFKKRLQFCFMESPTRQYPPRTIWTRTTRTIYRTLFPTLFAFFLLSLLLAMVQPEVLVLQDEAELGKRWYPVEENVAITEATIPEGNFTGVVMVSACVTGENCSSQYTFNNGTITGWVIAGYMEQAYLENATLETTEAKDSEWFEDLVEENSKKGELTVSGRITGAFITSGTLLYGERLGGNASTFGSDRLENVSVNNATILVSGAIRVSIANATVYAYGLPPEERMRPASWLGENLVFVGVFVIAPLASLFATLILILKDSSLMIYSTRHRYLESYGRWINQRFRAIGGFGVLVVLVTTIYEFWDVTGHKYVPILTIIASLCMYPLIFITVYIYKDKWHNRIVNEFDKKVKKEFPEFNEYYFEESHGEIALIKK